MVETVADPYPDGDFALAGLTSRTRTWLLTVACFGVLLVISSMVALNTALPDIAIATSATQTQLTWVVDSYTLVLACLLLPAGALGDRYGRRGAMLVGLAIFAAASLVPAVLSDPLIVIISRGVAGAGAALIMPATLSLITAAHPKDQRNKAVGIWAGVAGCGAVVGMLGSGALLNFWSWHSIFWGFAGAASTIFVLTLTIASSREADAHPLDWRGAVVIAGSVATLVFGILEAPARGWTHPLVLSTIGTGLLLGLAFGFVEMRQRYPLLDVRLFAVPAFAIGAATITVFFLSMFGYLFLLMQYMQLILGYSPNKTALALSPIMGPVLVLSVLSFWYLPRLGLRTTIFVGLLFIALGSYCMAGIAVDSPYWRAAWPMLIMSVGIGMCTAPTTSAIMTTAPDDKQGVASAVNDASREIGAALGIALAGSMLAARYAQALAPNLTGFPKSVGDAAATSLGQALEVSRRLGPAGTRLAEASKVAFIDAMHSSLLVLAILIAVSAVLIGLWAPGRDGQQLRPVRYLLARRRSK
ncbi:MFS transporter [Candidatus Mycobacterium wuenschmannii]|uniref:MFS transporter n=1 Tax=Candidatus Mycobacterium wuenschmannii TaxID=3027808 RepID=A0ABY8VT46_9MYCO|nr:MFS transporter [Candidatus Mycobacterium wuenschmannii]WIM86795.1 MFS transporter [Candidatus Mycobacterium wuenschmannii]